MKNDASHFLSSFPNDKENGFKNKEELGEYVFNTKVLPNVPSNKKSAKKEWSESEVRNSLTRQKTGGREQVFFLKKCVVRKMRKM